MNNLPDFLILGVMRAGTSTLHALLGPHPKIKLPKRKEIHYFNGKIKTLKKYKSFFPDTAEDELTFDGTGHYLMWPHAPESVKGIIPKPSFIILLRDPTERAWSEWQLTYQSDGLRLHDIMNPDNICVRRGLYAENIKRWFEIFDKSAFLILKSDSLWGCPQETMDLVFNWLGLFPFKIKEKTYVDPFMWRKNKFGYSEVSEHPEIEKWLRDFYAEPNREFNKLFGLEGAAWEEK